MIHLRSNTLLLLGWMLFALSLPPGCAQADYYLGNHRYPFIGYDSNKFVVPTTDAMAPFYVKMDSLLQFGHGKINIVHIGGSHIQADTYTHLVRKRLQTMQLDANGGRGFIFPFSTANTNNPGNYKVYTTGRWQGCRSTVYKDQCTWGLNGIQVRTTDSMATLAINPNRDSSIYYTFNQVRVFHALSPYRIYVSAIGSEFSGSYDTVKGCSIIHLPCEVDSLHLTIVKDSGSIVPFELYGLTLDTDNTGFVYHSIGVNGAMLRHYLDCTLWEQQLAALDPDLIIFSIGTNDAYTKRFSSSTFYERYSQLVERAKHAAPTAALLITVPNDSYLYRRYPNRNTALMRDQIFKLAKQYNMATWDFYSIMGGFNSSQAWYNSKLMQYDRIHFNREGYLLKGDLFFSAMLKFWEDGLSMPEIMKTNKEYYFYSQKNDSSSYKLTPAP